MAERRRKVLDTSAAVETLKSKGRYKSAKAIGVVTCFEVMTLSAFIERIGTTRNGVIDMRERGLVVRKDGGKRILVHGQDFCNYVLSLPVAELDRQAPDGQQDDNSASGD